MELKDLCSDQIDQIATALAKAQGVMTNAEKNSTNPHFRSKYASLDSVVDAAREAMSANGLSYVQPLLPVPGGGAVLVTRMMHTSGQWLQSFYPLSMAGTPQQQGSALTYARRYALMALLGIAPSEADDDGNEATRAHEQNGRKPPQAAPSTIDPQEVEPPIDPETGEVSPHTIAVATPVELGQKLIAAIDVAKDELEIDAWLQANNERLTVMKERGSNTVRIIQQVADARRGFLRSQ